MPERYIVRRTTDTDYAIERPDGTTLLTETFAEKPDIPGDFAAALVNYAEANGQSGIVEVLDFVLTGVNYRDDTR